MTTIRRAGFTLIELMIAMAIATVAAVAVFGLFLSQSRSMRQSQDVMEMHDNVRIALDFIARDLRSSGFFTPDGTAIRIENNCGGSGTGGTAAPQVDIGTGIGDFTVPGATGTAISANGDIQGTTEKDGCPNGSDRLTVFYRPRTDFADAVGGPGNSLQLDVACPEVSSGTYDCMQIFQNSGIQGTDCSSAGTMSSNSIPMCLPNDPYSCFTVRVTPRTGSGCSTCNNATCTLDVYGYDGDSWEPFQSLSIPYGGDWDHVFCDPPGSCNGKDNTALSAWVQRTYQLYDVDGDGSTELVYSDNVNSLLRNPAASASSAQWIPIANFIDDFQVAYAHKSAPGTFYSRTLWNTVSGCTAGGNLYCLINHLTDPPISVRVSMVARSSKRNAAAVGSGVQKGQGRPQLEDNNPAFTAFSTASIPTGGARCYGSEACGCGSAATVQNYMKCSLNGNAEGYSRRVVTEVIGLRNLQ